MSLSALVKQISPLDAELRQRIQARLDNLTKPVGSLGRLEQLALRYACVRRNEALRAADEPLRYLEPKACVVVMAADHGVAEEGVSAFPQVVTGQMLQNFAAGGAAINVLSRAANAELKVVDLGVLGDTPPGVMNRKVRAGSRNMAKQPAMTSDETQAAIQAGVELAEQLAAEGFTTVCLGEMGIANTTPAAALAAVFCGCPVEQVVGRGTGVDDAGLLRKTATVRRSLEQHSPDRERPLSVLSQVGGLEIAGLVGLCLGAAANGLFVLLDGFITSSAALCAARLCPAVKEYMAASHCSQEPGHRVILDELGLVELLNLELRLGEGTGAALALPLLGASVAILNDMATFESAGIATRDA